MENGHVLEKAILEIFFKIMSFVESLEPYTKGHAWRVSQYAKEVGIHLDLPKYTLKNLELAGSIHDIGKIGISESLLLKNGSLNQDEWEKIKSHPTLSVNLLESFPFLKSLIPIIRHHHEKWDGTGYPDGLKGAKIPLGARILAIIDCFDALLSDRSFREKFSFKDAVKIIENNLGKNFDPEIGRAFLELLEKKKEKLKQAKILLIGE